MTPQLLVTTDWLAERLNDPALRILDVRGHVLPPDQPLPHYYSHRAEYDEAHLPGALFVDWTTDIVEPGSPSQDIANPERYAAFMASVGVGDETLVVAYDDAGGMFAARLWWTLNYYGHSQVVVLDGGWQKWLAEGRPTTSVVPQVPPAHFTPRIQPTWRRTADEIAARAAAVPLVDVRSVEEFAGKMSRAKRAGHIPGAINLPRAQLLNADGTLKAPDALRLIFEAAHIRLDAPDIMVYCNGGVSASYGMLALLVAGAAQASVYDGSWKDWGNQPDRPIV